MEVVGGEAEGRQLRCGRVQEYVVRRGGCLENARAVVVFCTLYSVVWSTWSSEVVVVVQCNYSVPVIRWEVVFGRVGTDLILSSASRSTDAGTPGPFGALAVTSFIIGLALLHSSMFGAWKDSIALTTTSFILGLSIVAKLLLAP